MAAGLGEDESGAISGINVTPLVDVMLVLLVIFMVTAPMIQQGVAVELPASKGQSLPSSKASEPYVVSVTADGATFVNDRSVTMAELRAELVDLVGADPGAAVYLRADSNARYGAVVEVISVMKRVGVEQLGMITEPRGDSSSR